ncbi:MAG: phosphoadenosine phosphosulfate reductase family protein [Nitrospinae bacterium]|nr:phosphoadenosine phosphosulfate reductase family protein [Nitrospinota bacterium]
MQHSANTGVLRQLSFLQEDKAAEAMEFLLKHEPQKGYAVKFSGGKDSIVVYDLVLRSGVRHRAFYNCTTIDPPEVAKFIRRHYPEVQWLYPHRNFFDYVMRRGLPTKVKRWCCEKLKHRVSKRTFGTKHLVVGIRAEESHTRSVRGRISEMEGQTIYSPIFNFDEGEVWDYIESRGLPYPSLYNEGFSRLGCVICPYICRGGGVLEKHKERWPAMYRRFEAVVAAQFEAKRGFFQERGITGPKELLDLWYASRPIPHLNARQVDLFSPKTPAKAEK